MACKYRRLDYFRSFRVVKSVDRRSNKIEYVCILLYIK